MTTRKAFNEVCIASAQSRHWRKSAIGKLALFLMAAAFATFAYADLDETLVAPESSVVFYVHGHLNLVFTSNDTTVAYASFVPGQSETAFAYDVEIRPTGDGEEAWTSCSGTLSKYTNSSNREFRDASRFFWLGSSEIDSSVEVRARIRITKEGDVKCGAWSAWRNLGTADVLDELNGTVIQSNSKRAGEADDGDLNTFYEDGSSSPSWTGLDAGSEAVVSRIRFTHRNFNATAQNRGKGAVFEAANEADFSDAVQLHVVPNDYNPFAVNDISLETPVRARYFRVRTTSGNFCNFSEVQWVGCAGCQAELAGDGGESDYRARVAARGNIRAFSSLRLLRGYSASGPYAAITSSLPVSEPLVAVDETSGVGLPCYYCWECTMNSGIVITGVVSSVYTRPRQLERDAADQTVLGEGVLLLPANALFPDKTYSKANTVKDAFDGDLETSPNSNLSTITNPVVGVSLPAPAHLACVFVNADCQNNNIRTPRMKRLALYGAESTTSLNDGEYVQLAAPITTYQYPDDDYRWFRYNSTDTNSLFACLFGYAPTSSGQWCGHAREIRFVGWTEADAIASGKVLAPEGVSVAYGSGVVTVSWTSAVNASSLSIERRQDDGVDWTVIAADVDPSALSYVDGNRLRGGHAYYYRVRSTGLGGLMSAETEPVSVLIPKKGFVISFM